MTDEKKGVNDQIDFIVDAVIEYIDHAELKDIEELTSSTVAGLSSRGRDIISAARKASAEQRRSQAKQRMATAVARTKPDVSAYSVGELREILRLHIANDDASATMAARHEAGEIDEAELRSIVADVLSLKDPD